MIAEVADLERYMKTGDHLNGCCIAKALYRLAEEKATTIQEVYALEVADYAMEKMVSWEVSVERLSVEYELNNLKEELHGVLRKLNKIMQRLHIS